MTTSAFGIDHGDISKSLMSHTSAVMRAGKTAKEAGKRAKKYEEIEGKYSGDYIKSSLNRAVKPEFQRKMSATTQRNALLGQAAGRRKVRYRKLESKAKRTRNIRNASIGTAGAAATSYSLSKSEKPPLAPDKLRHKKKVSAATTIISSTLGIAGLGALAAGKGGPRLAGKLVKHPKFMAKAPKKVKVLVNDQKKIKIKGEKASNAAMALSTGATGFGGIGGYNYASIQRAEARKKRL